MREQGACSGKGGVEEVVDRGKSASQEEGIKASDQCRDQRHPQRWPLHRLQQHRQDPDALPRMPEEGHCARHRSPPPPQQKHPPAWAESQVLLIIR